MKKDKTEKAYSVAEIRRSRASAYAKWSREDDEWLKQVYDDFRYNGPGRHKSYNKMIAAIAGRLGRKPGAISSRIKKLFYPPAQMRDIVDFEVRTAAKSGRMKSSRRAVSSPDEMTFSTEALEALWIMEETTESLFLTGRAGTGKSTLLNYFREKTKKNVAVLAPTGVAALNVRGQTIHSFCKFTPETGIKKIKKLPPWDERPELIKHLDAIVIDEVSMVRADLMDMLDKFLRLNGGQAHAPFGGLQMIFIGDLYQLPPVVVSAEREVFAKLYPSPYFFDALVFKNHKFRFLELETVYRQRDEKFIELLNAVRNNTADEAHLEAINKRVRADRKLSEDDFSICLTSTNALASSINSEKLGLLSGKAKIYQARISGKFDAKQIPTEMELEIKSGAQVMLLNNDRGRRWVNGTMGKVVKIIPGSELAPEEPDGEIPEEEGEVLNNFQSSSPGSEADAIVVELENGGTHYVFPHTWEMFEYGLGENKSLDIRTVGKFTQYPLKLAWAVTIHKAQGKTFDKVVIDLGRGAFAHGQTYVALSRCRTLEGLVLKHPLLKRHILMDWRVVKFVTGYQYVLADARFPAAGKMEMIQRAIKNGNALRIVYLKANDEKSRRVIEPVKAGEMEYQGKTYVGVEAFCRNRRDNRVFRIDRILEMEMVE